MNFRELETAVRLGLDLVPLELTDNAYGMIRWKQADMESQDFPHFLTGSCLPSERLFF